MNLPVGLIGDIMRYHGESLIPPGLFEFMYHHDIPSARHLNNHSYLDLRMRTTSHITEIEMKHDNNIWARHLIKTFKSDPTRLKNIQKNPNDIIVDWFINNDEFITAVFMCNPNEKAVQYCIEKQYNDIAYLADNLNEKVVQYCIDNIDSASQTALFQISMNTSDLMVEFLIKNPKYIYIEYACMNTNDTMVQWCIDNLDKDMLLENVHFNSNNIMVEWFMNNGGYRGRASNENPRAISSSLNYLLDVDGVKLDEREMIDYMFFADERFVDCIITMLNNNLNMYGTLIRREIYKFINRNTNKRIIKYLHNNKCDISFPELIDNPNMILMDESIREELMKI